MRTTWIRNAVVLASGLVLLAALPAAASSPRELLDKFRAHPPVIEANAPDAGALWVKSFGSGTGLDDAGFIEQATNGGLFFTGTTTSFGAGAQDLLLMKLDDGGAILWAKAYGTPGNDSGGFEPTGDGGFVALVATGDQAARTYSVVKTDASGAIQWQKSVAPTSGTITLYQVLPTPDGYVLVGMPMSSSIPIPNNVLLAKLDLSGNSVWQKQYGFADFSAAFMGGVLQRLGDGTFAMSGTLMSMVSADTDMFLAKFDASGNLTWQKAYGGPSQDVGGAALATSDGGFLLEGYTKSYGMGGDLGDSWFLKLDSTGNISWQKAYGGVGDESLAALQDGTGFVASGAVSATPGGMYHGLVMKLDGSGNITWQKNYGGSGQDILFAFPDGSGAYLISGDTNSFGAGGTDTWGAKIDGSGAFVWQKTYGGTGDDTGGLVQLAGGNLLVSGSTATGSSTSKFWAAKTGATGDVSTGCVWVHDGQAVASPGTLVVTPTTAQSRPMGLEVGQAALSLGTSAITSGAITLPSDQVCGGAPPVNPPAVSLIKKVSPPFKLVVTGSNLQSGIKVFINGAEWASVVWKNTGKIQLTGAIKTAVPKGTTKTFRFLNPDGGEVTQTWGW